MVGLFVLWTSCVIYFSPWRHPNRFYGILMIPLYAIFLLTFIWGIWSFGGKDALKANGFNWLNLLWLINIFIPVPIMFKKKWSDSGG